MCCRYYFDEHTYEQIQQIVTEIDKKIQNPIPNHDIHPSQEAPVIIADGQNAKLTLIRWGYPGIHTKDNRDDERRAHKGLIINARSESVLDKRIFRNGIQYHRAIIPARTFYEWNTQRERNTFQRTDEKPLYFAGFFDMLQNERRFVILTTAANESMLPVHDRMPLILEEEQIEEWLFDDSMAAGLLNQKQPTLHRKSDYEQLTLF